MNLDNSMTVIGSNEYIDFKRQNVLKVPAKIDTGADSSAVWASDIKLIEGKVVFKLFGSTSKFYTGKTIVSSSYRISLVKNTSGVKERRFKVRLSVRVKDRNIRTWFTLADRSDMIYPALLGRKTLHNKFIIDVSQKSVKDLD
jgi:hypothetical protein